MLRHWTEEEISNINTATDSILEEARRTKVPPPHCCGAGGFGQQPWDRCPRCEWEEQANGKETIWSS